MRVVSAFQTTSTATARYSAFLMPLKPSHCMLTMIAMTTSCAECLKPGQPVLCSTLRLLLSVLLPHVRSAKPELTNSTARHVPATLLTHRTSVSRRTSSLWWLWYWPLHSFAILQTTSMSRERLLTFGATEFDLPWRSLQHRFALARAS